MQVDYAAGVVHDNIVQLLDVFVEGEQYVIVVSLSPFAVKFSSAHIKHTCLAKIT